MHPLSDKDLDRLSREAAEQYDVEQNTSGWDKLEQKLNKHLPERGKKDRRRFLFFIWAFVLLSGGGLTWLLAGNPSSPLITLKEKSISPTEVDSQTTQVPETASNPNSKVITGDENTPETKERPSETEGTDLNTPNGSQNEQKAGSKVDNNVTNKVLDNTRDKVADNNSQTTIRNKQQKSGLRRNTHKHGNLNQIEERKTANNLQDVTDKAVSVMQQESASGKPPGDKNETVARVGEIDQSRPKQDTLSAGAPATNQVQVDSAELITAQQRIDSTTIETPIKKKSAAATGQRFRKGIEIGLVGAPDMSNVKFTNSDQVGFNVGVQIGYRISNRWSVTTGAIYTQKNYTSKGKDFNPPKGSWLDNVKLDEVEGNCYMFDIPLNVRYDLTNGNKQRFFLSTGLSTYLMKQEDYHYYYQYTNGSPGYRYRSYPSSEQHWMSILNISAGFEKKLNKHFSMQAEPYLKIPLAGVGYGNLKLNSYGVYLAFKYNPGLFSGRKR